MRSSKEQGSVQLILGQLDLGSEAVEICWSARGLLTRVCFAKAGEADEKGPEIPDRARRLAGDLRAYLENGTPISSVSWDDVDAGELSEFQRKVYSATISIPYGETRTYGWVARRIGSPAGSRAVGQALSRNPVPLLVPCHRVVSNQSLGGFMGVGFMGESRVDAPELRLKRKLLELESGFVNSRFL